MLPGIDGKIGTRPLVAVRLGLAVGNGSNSGLLVAGREFGIEATATRPATQGFFVGWGYIHVDLDLLIDSLFLRELLTRISVALQRGNCSMLQRAHLRSTVDQSSTVAVGGSSS